MIKKKKVIQEIEIISMDVLEEFLVKSEDDEFHFEKEIDVIEKEVVVIKNIIIERIIENVIDRPVEIINIKEIDKPIIKEVIKENIITNTIEKIVIKPIIKEIFKENIITEPYIIIKEVIKENVIIIEKEIIIDNYINSVVENKNIYSDSLYHQEIVKKIQNPFILRNNGITIFNSLNDSNISFSESWVTINNKRFEYTNIKIENIL